MPIRHAGKSRVVVVTALGMVLGWGWLAGVAGAALITFNFEGTVTSVSPAVSPYFSTSDRLVGSFSFDSAAPDLSPSAQYGTYQVDQLSFTLGSNTYDTGVGNQIRIVSNSSLYPNPSPDRYSVVAVQTIGPSAGALLPRGFAFTISGVRQFDDSLLLTPPSLANFLSTERVFDMAFVQPVGAVGHVVGELTSLTLAPVPVPGAVILFGTGLIGLVALGRRNLMRQS